MKSCMEIAARKITGCDPSAKLTIGRYRGKQPVIAQPNVLKNMDIWSYSESNPLFYSIFAGKALQSCLDNKPKS